MSEPKLQKVLAEAGYGSRRACEQMIREGRVRVNGQRARLGARVDPATVAIRVDGQPLQPPEPLRYVAYHKPAGVLSSYRSQGDWPTVFELVDTPERLHAVGRLDLESEGLLLLTNDGALTYRLTHPRFGHEKEYRVLLDRMPDDDQWRSWSQGLTLDDERTTGPVELAREPDGWLRVTMRQGMKRQIRETARTLGLRVSRIVRTRIENLQLDGLAAGEWRDLSDSEIIRLRSAVQED